MKISPLILATRSISSEFIRREYTTVLWIVGLVFVGLHLLGVWLISQSSWWWILEIFLIFLTAIAAALAALVFFLVKKLRPRQSLKQRKMVRSFVDSLQEFSETAQTPKFLLIFRLIKDAIFPSPDSLVKQLASKSTALRPDFQKIVQLFDKQ